MPGERNNLAREPKEGKIIDLGERRRKAALMESNSARAIDRDDCLRALEAIAPLPGDLADLLQIPSTLYRADLGLGDSFSSSPDKDIARAAGSLILGMELPADFADYGIHISSRGSNVFCTMADRRRKVIVCEDVRNMFSSEGSWVSFSDSLKEALSISEQKESRGEKFSFVVIKDSLSRII